MAAQVHEFQFWEDVMPGVLQKLNAAFRQIVKPTLIASAAVLTLAVGTGAQLEQAPKDKTAGQYYKNIKVLNDIPASDLLPGMRYITTALGVRCDYCHVKPFDKDAKPEKETARQMMTMLFAINKNNFDGRSEVSCYTCHQGNHQPIGVPPLPAEAVAPQFIRPTASSTPQPLPSADAVLDKYAQAIGSEEALSKVTSREIQLQETDSDGKTYAVETYEKGLGKMYEVTTLPEGQITAGFDGSRAWVASSQGTRDAEPSDAIILRREAAVNPAAALKGYTDKRVRGQAKIGDETTYVMQAKAPDGIIELLFFDEHSGLLVRRMIRNRTIFGSLPVQADYADYKPVDGVNIPYKTTWSKAGESSSYTIKDVKNNVPVDDSKFEPPA
ncbi:MAG TPA: c-type cytochrome, partial [Candidatus Angelobacter sp.]|nr:c-type cytochrome [Candidatus Angelobacter sp.]